MSDLDVVKRMLFEEELTLAIAKNGEVLFKTRSHRISGFLDAIERFGAKLEGASLADRVAGKAVALLCVHVKISEVYAEVLSKKAEMVFQESGVRHEWKVLVDNILDFNKKGVCPFEKAAESISDPEDAYRTFKALQESLKACR